MKAQALRDERYFRTEQKHVMEVRCAVSITPLD